MRLQNPFVVVRESRLHSCGAALCFAAEGIRCPDLPIVAKRFIMSSSGRTEWQNANYQVDTLVALLPLYDGVRQASVRRGSSLLPLTRKASASKCAKCAVFLGRVKPSRERQGSCHSLQLALKTQKKKKADRIPKSPRLLLQRYRDQKRYIESLRLLATPATSIAGPPNSRKNASMKFRP